jgi:sulfofructosephosphate aldolase
VDPTISADYLREVGAAAIKFLVIWRAGEKRSENAESVARVVELAKEAGVASLVEGIVRTDDDSPFTSPEARDEAILAAAEDLMAARPDVYKAEVPGNRPGDQSRVTEQSRLMSDIVKGDWVVLSNGVLAEDFPAAVRAAVAGGAKGFLAGRAIWADTLREPNAHELLRTRSVERLQLLTDIVDGRA